MVPAMFLGYSAKCDLDFYPWPIIDRPHPFVVNNICVKLRGILLESRITSKPKSSSQDKEPEVPQSLMRPCRKLLL